MEILLVLAGVLLGVGITFGGLAVRSLYLEWRVRQNWAIAGRRWREILDNMSYKRVSGHWTPKVLTPEERLADLERRVSGLFDGTIPIDFEDTLTMIDESDNKFSPMEAEAHRLRLADKAEGAFVPTSFDVGEDIADSIEERDPRRAARKVKTS